MFPRQAQGLVGLLPQPPGGGNGFAGGAGNKSLSADVIV